MVRSIMQEGGWKNYCVVVKAVGNYEWPFPLCSLWEGEAHLATTALGKCSPSPWLPQSAGDATSPPRDWSPFPSGCVKLEVPRGLNGR